jgi:twitching motility protein PilT
MLASTLRGAISQRLVPTADNSNRVAVAEIMVATGRVKDLILQPNETGKIGEVISEGAFYGMQTFDQDLLKHVQAGRISEAVAMDTASSPHDFKLMLAAGGQRASGIEQIMGDADETSETPVPAPVPQEQVPPEPVPAAPVPAAPAPSAPPAAPAGNGSAAPPGPPPGA